MKFFSHLAYEKKRASDSQLEGRETAEEEKQIDLLPIGFRWGKISNGGQGQGGPVQTAKIHLGQLRKVALGLRVRPVTNETFGFRDHEVERG